MFQKMTDDQTSSTCCFVQNNSLSESDLLPPPPPLKKKRNLPGTPDPEAEVIALSPKTLMATNRFLCEICGKGFQRDQNLQLHRRGHNLPWKLKQRTSKEVKKRVYVCPEKSCVHHHPSRALGDLTGIKKHFCRKHGEKKWKCDKCSKRYAVQSDWKAHSKTCGTREYKCDCGTIFSRRDSFITHRAFCDALAEETARINAASSINIGMNSTNTSTYNQHFSTIFKPMMSTEDTRGGLSLWMLNTQQQQLTPPLFGDSSSSIVSISNINQPPPPQPDYAFNWVFETNTNNNKLPTSEPIREVSVPSLYSSQQVVMSSANMSATALLQKAAEMGATTSTSDASFFGLKTSNNNQENVNNISTLNELHVAKRRREESGGVGGETRDFLGVGVQEISVHPSTINGWI